MAQSVYTPLEFLLLALFHSFHTKPFHLSSLLCVLFTLLWHERILLRIHGILFCNFRLLSEALTLPKCCITLQLKRIVHSTTKTRGLTEILQSLYHHIVNSSCQLFSLESRLPYFATRFRHKKTVPSIRHIGSKT